MVSSKASWLWATGIPAPATTSQRETVAEPFDISASTEKVIVIGPRSIGSKVFAAIGIRSSSHSG
jgi:hypothetical protein